MTMVPPDTALVVDQNHNHSGITSKDSTPPPTTTTATADDAVNNSVAASTSSSSSSGGTMRTHVSPLRPRRSRDSSSTTTTTTSSSVHGDGRRSSRRSSTTTTPRSTTEARGGRSRNRSTRSSRAQSSKKVSIDIDNIHVQQIPNVLEMLSKEEIDKVWFSTNELNMTLRECAATALAMREGQPIDDGNSSEQTTTRGLEHMTPEGFDISKNNKATVQEVLDEQKRQKESGIKDPDLLAFMYGRVCVHRQRMANLMGMRDAREIEAELQEEEDDNEGENTDSLIATAAVATGAIPPPPDSIPGMHESIVGELPFAPSAPSDRRSARRAVESPGTVMRRKRAARANPWAKKTNNDDNNNDGANDPNVANEPQGTLQHSHSFSVRRVPSRGSFRDQHQQDGGSNSFNSKMASRQRRASRLAARRRNQNASQDGSSSQNATFPTTSQEQQQQQQSSSSQNAVW